MSRHSASLTSPESRLPQTRNGRFPVTPIKSQEGAKQNAATPRSNDQSTPTPTIRERRGRRQYLATGDFHPLSIFTRSVLFPFQLDTDKAFEILKSDSPDRLREAKNALSPETRDDDLIEKENTPPSRLLYEKCTPSPKRPASQSIMGTIAYCPSSDMDLITALKMTSPEKDSATKLHAEFATLCELPIPEPSQHPAFSSNPFEAKTEAPLLFTPTSVDEIRLLKYKNIQRDSSSKLGRDSIERKRSFFGLELRTPSSARSRNAFSQSEDSPLPLSIATPGTGNTIASVKGSSPLHTGDVTPRESAGSHSTTNSVRKFSDLFRRKDSIEQSLDSLTCTHRDSQDSPYLDRNDLVGSISFPFNLPSLTKNSIRKVTSVQLPTPHPTTITRCLPFPVIPTAPGAGSPAT